MVVNVAIVKGAGIPAATWNDEDVLWDSTAESWDQSGTEQEQIRDSVQITLNKSTGEDNSTSRLTMTYDNPAGRNKDTFVTGEEITLLADKDINPPTTKLFSGNISDISFQGKGPKERIVITARDFTNLLQKTTVEPEVYTNQTIEFIVEDIITKYAPSTFTINNVQATGKTLTRMQFKQISVFDALKQLAQLATFFFYVDESKDLHFEPKSTVSSGEILDSSNIIKSRFREDADAVKNRIFVYGDRSLVAHPQETFTGDGVGSIFTLETNPHNTKMVVSGVDQVGDIFKGDNSSVESGVNYLINFHDRQIIFVSGTDLGYNSIPGSLFPVTADYQQSRPIIKLAQDQTSIAQFGERTEVIIDDAIQDPRSAADRAKAELVTKKDPSIQGNIDLQGLVILTPGNTVLVNLPFENQNNQTYDVLSATYTFDIKTLKSEKVLKTKISRRIVDITDVIKELILGVKELQANSIDTGGILSRLELSTGSTGLRESLWKVKTRTIGNSVIFGHPINGIMGSPVLGVNGSQILFGDHRDAQTIIVSGVQAEAT